MRALAAALWGIQTLAMIFSRMLSATLAAIVLSVSACTQPQQKWPYTSPFTLEGVAPGAHLTESQAIEVANAEVRAQGRDPSLYPAPTATFADGKWSVHFDSPPGPPPPALGNHFSVYIYEKDNAVWFAPGR